MPAFATSLISGAGVIFVATIFFSNQNARYGLRLTCMIAAGVALVFAYLMPEHAPTLISGAGSIAAISLFFF
ncbi:MAG TPA: hypothetical protein VJC16_01615 [Candidatus Nanoarchaeia archaeon]|nr:hypothetical protein [Candidatus Nanoarchaeia archaeon]